MMDLAMAISSSCRIWENLDGEGGSWEFHNCPGVAGYMFCDINSVDIDADGDMDIVGSGLQNYVDDILVIFENLDGRGSEWIHHAIRTENALARFKGISDVNNDGYIDVLGAVSGPSVLWCDVMGPAHAGWVQSSILDVTEYPDWESISWISTEPSGTDVSFLLKSSNNPEDMGVWCDTISDPGNLTGYIDSTHRYIQYLACMTTDSDNYGPVLDEVSLVWSNTGIEGEAGDYAPPISVSPNPACNEVSITVPTWGQDIAEVSIYDISGKLVVVVTNRINGAFQWDCRSASGLVIPSGIYIVRCVSGDLSSTTRLVRL